MDRRSQSDRLQTRLIGDFLRACRQRGVRPTRFVLAVDVQAQTMSLLERHGFQKAWSTDLGLCHAAVAQTCSLPFRRFATCRAPDDPPITNRRYGRLKTCATPPWFKQGIPNRSNHLAPPIYDLRRRYRVSTSRFGVGQRAGSNQTPLGLHRIAEKIGAGQPIGTAFRSRQAVGLIWQGFRDEPIVHRILWLEGLEPGCNHGGHVDSRQRYIYIHGTSDELTLGRPASLGCIHLAAADLLPLFDQLPVGTLVWIR